MPSPLRSADQGSAAVEVTLILAGLVTVFLAVLQVGIAGMTHVLVSGAASDAARGAAVAQDPTVGQARMEAVAGLPFITVVDQMVHEAWIDGLHVAEVRVTARVPTLLPWGAREVKVVRHSLIEQP